MSIQFTRFVLCHIILPNLFVVTCMSHCGQGECQLGGKFLAEICCLKYCLIVFLNIHFCFVCYFADFGQGESQFGTKVYAEVFSMYLLH